MAALNTTLKNKFQELENANPTLENSPPKIQKVAEYLRSREKIMMYYLPKLVSMGPIHHGNKNLELGEKYKRFWAKKYMESTKLKPNALHQRIADKIGHLKSLFADEISNKYPEGFDEELSWILFVDGCALLHILKNAKLEKAKDMNIKVDQLVLVMMDVLLLENQLPYLVLELLWNETKGSLIKTMEDFLQCHHWTQGTTSDSGPNNDKENPRQQHIVDVPDESHHLLDLQRKIILHQKGKGNKTNENNSEDKKNKMQNHTGTNSIMDKTEVKQDKSPIDKDNETNENNSKESNDKMTTFRNIQELRASGIRLSSSKTRSPTHIKFYEGWFAATLELPEIVVDDTTAITFFNLIAYEMCPDFENNYEICSFAFFMDSLIDHPDDVKELRAQRILLNSLGSDKEVADLFNIISTDLVANMETYSEVRLKINQHYLNTCKGWIALGFHTYFNNPWAIIAFLAAVFALVLTFIQTWLAIHPIC